MNIHSIRASIRYTMMLYRSKALTRGEALMRLDRFNRFIHEV